MTYTALPFRGSYSNRVKNNPETHKKYRIIFMFLRYKTTRQTSRATVINLR